MLSDQVKLGSATAKGGFANEKDIINKFNSWKTDNEAKIWLQIMGYNLEEIKKVQSINIKKNVKCDIQIQITLSTKKGTVQRIENLSLKKAYSNADYNQVDKRWVSKYEQMWDLPKKIVIGLKMFSGDLSPEDLLKKKQLTIKNYRSLIDKRRFFLEELEEDIVASILEFFSKNKNIIIKDLLKGKGEFAVNWILVTQMNRKTNETSWVLKNIDEAIKIFGDGEVKISPHGSLYIGRITMQRKGGDAGRPTANMLQFKIKPCDLFRGKDSFKPISNFFTIIF